MLVFALAAIFALVLVVVIGDNRAATAYVFTGIEVALLGVSVTCAIGAAYLLGRKNL